MEAMKITANVDQAGFGSFEIDGKAFPVTAATIEMRAGEPTRVTLCLPPVPVEVVTESMLVTVQHDVFKAPTIGGQE